MKISMLFAVEGPGRLGMLLTNVECGALRGVSELLLGTSVYRELVLMSIRVPAF